MRKEINDGLSQITFNEGQKEQVMKQLEERVIEKGEERVKRKFLLAAIISVCLIAFGGICFAADIPQKLLAGLGIEFQQINESSIYDGIELRVIAAANDEDAIEIYFTLQDLTGDRITADTSIYDFRLDNAPILGCHQVGFEEETGIAHFVLKGNSGSSLKQKKLDLQISSFVSGNNKIEPYSEESIDLYELLMSQGSPVFHSENDQRWNWQSEKQELFAENPVLPAMEPGTMELGFSGLKWFTISNVGFQDGFLYVQIKKDEDLGMINHGYFYLTDAEGNRLDYESFSNGLPEYQDYAIYVEDTEQLKDVQLWGSFTDADTLYEGNWQVTFKVEGVDTKSIDCDISTGEETLYQVDLSLLGITFYYKGQEHRDKETFEEPEVTLYFQDGSSRAVGGSMFNSSERGRRTLKIQPEHPLAIEEITAIEINHIFLPFEK